MALWVPPKVARDLREETAAFNAATLSMFEFHGPVFDEWNGELKKLDPLLRLGKAKESADAIGVIPGFYHLVRLPEGISHLWTMPLYNQNEAGQYMFVEPTSALLQILRERDMQNMQVTRARVKAAEDKEKKEAKDRAERLERLTDEGFERWKAYSQVRIPFNTGSWKWSQNHAGQRGRRVAGR